jgi:glycosyltransferase 2 family protein
VPVFGSLKNKKIQTRLLNAAFAVLAVVSLYYAFAGKDLQELTLQLKTANYFWVIPVLGSALLGSIARALRWQLLLEAGGNTTRLSQTFYPLMYGYFVNIGTPRLGEFARCIALEQVAKVPFAKSFGTVFTERAVDLVCLLIVVFTAFVLQAEFLGNFFTDAIYAPINAKTGGNAFGIFIALVVAGVVGIVFVFFFLQRLNKTKPANKIILFVKGVLEGIVSIFKLRKKGLFLLYTLTIWFTYFLTSYLWFFAFEATENLTVAAAFTVMGVGAIAKSTPIQGGGMGAYHFLVGKLLLLYQLSGVSTLAYATLNHGTQLVYNIVLGLIAVVWLLVAKRKG